MESGRSSAITPAKKRTPHIDASAYQRMYRASVDNPDEFRAEQGKRIDWIKPFNKVKDTSFGLGKIKWFEDGTPTSRPIVSIVTCSHLYRASQNLNQAPHKYLFAVQPIVLEPISGEVIEVEGV